MMLKTILFLGLINGLLAQMPDGQPEYRLQPGDTVDVRFFFNPEMNEQGVQIRPDGRISMQMVGEVLLAGRTVGEVTRQMEKDYASLLKTPRVTVQIRGYAAQKAFISGEVPRPGTISLATPMTLLAALGEVLFDVV